MPQPSPFPPGKGGKPYGKRSKSLVYNMVRLNRTYYSLLKLQAKFSLNRTYYSLLKLQAKFSKLSPPVKIPAIYANYAQFAHTVREFRKIRTFC